MRSRPIHLATALIVIAVLHLAPASRVHALDVGSLPVSPWEPYPQPHQRGFDEIDDVPVRETACPVCGFAVAIPRVELLMRKSAAAPDASGAAWRMHAHTRDSDGCPHPGKNKIAYQADVVLCPSCGYAAAAKTFDKAVSPATAGWVLRTLQPNVRAAEEALLGKRAVEFDAAAMADFFNRQEELPDHLRLEHYRICLELEGAPVLDMARAAWLAGWAARREVTGMPKGAYLAARMASVRAAVEKREKKSPGLAGEAEAAVYFLGKNRYGKNRLPGGDRLAARLMLVGIHMRQGFHAQADSEVAILLREAGERFLIPEQDPLWSAISPKSSASKRTQELDATRADIEAELHIMQEHMKRERALLLRASEFIREAILAGELDGKPDEALFCAYLVGEFLRRHDNLPLAAEWFKNSLPLLAVDAPLRRAVETQLQAARDTAGENVNLLSALGQDGEVFEKLREICTK